jgi:hypothetical protein
MLLRVTLLAGIATVMLSGFAQAANTIITPVNIGDVSQTRYSPNAAFGSGGSSSGGPGGDGGTTNANVGSGGNTTGGNGKSGYINQGPIQWAPPRR